MVRFFTTNMILRLALRFTLWLVILLLAACIRSPDLAPSKSASNATRTLTANEPHTITAAASETKAVLSTAASTPSPLLWVTRTPEIAPTFTPTDNVLFLPQCDREPEQALPTITSPGKYQNWIRYTNNIYDFSLAFPSNWNLVEDRNYVCLKLQSEPKTILVIGFKRITETFSISRSGLGAGDLFPDGTVRFLGKEIFKEILRVQGIDKTILYQPDHDTIEISIGDLVFTISLDDYRSDYESARLTSETETIADEIVESVEIVH